MGSSQPHADECFASTTRAHLAGVDVSHDADVPVRVQRDGAVCEPANGFRAEFHRGTMTRFNGSCWGAKGGRQDGWRTCITGAHDLQGRTPAEADSPATPRCLLRAAML